MPCVDVRAARVWQEIAKYAAKENVRKIESLSRRNSLGTTLSGKIERVHGG